MCYNPTEMSCKGSERESVAIERPTNALERVADGQKTNLLREVSDDKEKDLLKVPDGLHEPQDEPQELQSLPVEGESRDSKQQAAEASTMAEGTSRRAEVIGKAAVVDGKAWPGSKPAKRASEVDEAEETPDGRQLQAKQVEIYHKKSQRNENANRNIPSAHGVCHDRDIPPHPVHPQSHLHAALFTPNSPHPNPIHTWTLSPPVLAFACTLQHLQCLCKRTRRAAIPLRLARTSLTNRKHSRPKCKSRNLLQSSRKQAQLLELVSALARYLRSL